MYTAPSSQASQPPLSVPDLLSQFRVRTVAEVIDASFRVYRRNFLTFLLIIILTAIPLQLLSYAVDIFVLGRFNQGSLTNFSSTSSLSSRIATNNVITQIGSIKDYLETYVLYFAQWALTSALLTSIYGGVATLRSSYGSLTANFGKALGLVGLRILIALGIYSPLLLTLALMVGGNSGISSAAFALSCVSPIVTIAYFIVDVRLKVALPAAVIEGLSPREAIRHSYNLTRNYWWRTFALVLVLGLLNAVVAAGPAALITALFGFSLQNIYASLAVTRLVSILTTSIFVSIEMGAIAFYYFDLRVRREGFDLENAIERRYQSGEYGQTPTPENYQFNPALSYSSYAQPTLGYAASAGADYPYSAESTRVRRVYKSDAPASTAEHGNEASS